ncbi:MAG: diphosphomevalonate/mevalonate 3,5-bisphosphate decarboxylase family protein [Bernardetiaceae bacterium]
MSDTLTAAWRSPSNIALVKYWGKHGIQLPQNPSLSFTLSDAYTETYLKASPGNRDGAVSVDFLFEGKPAPSFAQKVVQFLQHLTDTFPFLLDYHLEIDSHNSFPHSAGIASSASAMSALALCLCDLDKQLSKSTHDNFWQMASHIARLGSGSGARSVYGGLVVWGATPFVAESSDTFAVPLADELVHPDFKDYQDTILIISGAEKSVSSRAGHALMDAHPFAPVRFAQAQQNLGHLLKSIQSGDMEHFVALIEQEALTLHALMMSSMPSYMLLLPNTLSVLSAVRQFREETKIPLSFTLDAGPNVHLLYRKTDAPAVLPFIEQKLAIYCQNGRWISDQVGKGPYSIT